MGISDEPWFSGLLFQPWIPESVIRTDAADGWRVCQAVSVFPNRIVPAETLPYSFQFFGLDTGSPREMKEIQGQRRL